ncbi:MAG: 2'-5' RNA ligase family protein [Proteobacteria bacterium]|nr:2'-5' RNA ligase family protein [Pseudomonadota bacterium]
MTDPWFEFVAAERTAGPVSGVREDWHRGRATYVVWALRVSLAAERVERVRAAVGSWIRLVDEADLHVTAWVCGFPTDRPELDDDVATSVLEAQSVVAGRPVRLELGAATSFLACPALLVHDARGELAAVRAELGAHQRELRWAPYTPHVTVGSYLESVPTGPIVEALRPFRDEPRIEVVGRVQRVEVDARVPGAALRWC